MKIIIFTLFKIIKKNIRTLDNKNKNENYNVYSFQNHQKNIFSLDNINRNEKDKAYSFQNHKKILEL